MIIFYVFCQKYFLEFVLTFCYWLGGGGERSISVGFTGDLYTCTEI